MPVYPVQATFTRGELSPRLRGRIDLDHYKAGLQECLNFCVMRQGGLYRRPGTRFASYSKTNGASKEIFRTFEFNEDQAYILSFGASYLRFYTAGGRLTAAAKTITSITRASPAVVTSSSHGYSNGDLVTISGAVGMVEVNGREFTVAGATTNTFQLSGINSSAFTAYVSGGQVAKIIEVSTPYAEADLPYLQVAQSGDAVYITCPGYQQRKLVRSSDTSWSLSTLDIEDGPWLDEDEQGTYFTPASTGGITPLMTSNTLPSGTVSSSDALASAYQVFDRATGTDYLNVSSNAGNLAYDLAGTATAVCNAYWLRSTTDRPDRMIATWTFEGYTGSAWVVLDTRSSETGWGGGETRFYEFVNETAYQSYRIKWSATGEEGGSRSFIGDMGWAEHGDYQTAFNLTASAITGINGGTGFQTTDVGRSIRLLGSDGKWRWARIVSRTSTTVVKIRLYGHALFDLSPISRWQMSALSSEDGFPRAVGFYEDRLMFGGTDENPRRLYGSKSSEYENAGISSPLEDADGLNLPMTGGDLNQIVWIEEAQDLIVGTTGSIRTVGPNDTNSGFSATNAKNRRQSKVGACHVQPVTVEATTIFADRYAQRLHEIAYSLEINGYATPELTILSDHLFKRGILQLAYQANPNSIIWTVLGDGRLASVTYEKAQQVVGCAQIRIAGTAAYAAGYAKAPEDDCGIVESAAVIPSSSGPVLYLAVKRVVAGQTVRHIEYLADPFDEAADDVEDAVFLDASVTYEGAAVSAISGLLHLAGESVGIHCNGRDIGDAVVSATGTVTLPGSKAGTTITAGLRYLSRAKTLRLLQAGNQDGSHFGRLKRTDEIIVDLLATGDLSVGTTSGMEEFGAAFRAMDDAETDGDTETLKTGIFRVKVDDSWRNGGVAIFQTNKTYPAAMRAILLGVDGEP